MTKVKHVSDNNANVLPSCSTGSLAVRRKLYLGGLFPTVTVSDVLYDVARGANMAVQKINAQAELLSDVELTLMPHSTQCQTDATLDVYSAILQNNTKPLAGKVVPQVIIMTKLLVNNYFKKVVDYSQTCAKYRGR